jgi:hypothetical protein
MRGCGTHADAGIEVTAPADADPGCRAAVGISATQLGEHEQGLYARVELSSITANSADFGFSTLCWSGMVVFGFSSGEALANIGAQQV